MQLINPSPLRNFNSNKKKSKHLQLLFLFGVQTHLRTKILAANIKFQFGHPQFIVISYFHNLLENHMLHKKSDFVHVYLTSHES